MNIWAPQNSGLSPTPFHLGMPCARDGTLTWMYMDEFWGFNAKLYSWIWTWTTFELRSKAKNAFQNIMFSQHDMELTLFGTSVHLCIVIVERTCFLGQWGKCVMFEHCQGCVFVSWLFERMARTGYCAAFAFWPSFFVHLHLLHMLDSSGWQYSFVRISTTRAQRVGRSFATEWGWSECCQKGNSWWTKGPDLVKCMRGY